MSIKPAALCLGALALILSAYATAAQDTPISSRGLADMSCGAWVTSSQNPEVRAQYISWFLGFITGVNFADRDHQILYNQKVTEAALTLYVDKYCSNNPFGNLDGAAFELVRQQQKTSPQS